MTFEDLVEELVGDVFSEHEEARPPIVAATDGSATVRGDVPLREVNRALGLSLPEQDGAGTVAGLATNLAGGLPNRRARLAAHDGTVLEVIDVGAHSVRSVRIIPAPTVKGTPYPTLARVGVLPPIGRRPDKRIREACITASRCRRRRPGLSRRDPCRWRRPVPRGARRGRPPTCRPRTGGSRARSGADRVHQRPVVRSGM